MKAITMLAAVVMVLASCGGLDLVQPEEVCGQYADLMLAWECDCAEYAVDSEDRDEWLGICTRALGPEPVELEQADRCITATEAMTCEALEYPISCYRAK